MRLRPRYNFITASCNPTFMKFRLLIRRPAPELILLSLYADDRRCSRRPTLKNVLETGSRRWCSQLSASHGLRSIPLISGHLLLLRIKFYVSFINSLALIKSTGSVSNLGINNSNGGASRVREFGVPTSRWDVNEMLGFCLYWWCCGKQWPRLIRAVCEYGAARRTGVHPLGHNFAHLVNKDASHNKQIVCLRK